MSYKNILFEIKDNNIGLITFNREKVLNALNFELLDELQDAIKEVGENTNIKTLILTGAGEKSFVAGADISEIAKLDILKSKIFVKKGQRIISLLQELPIPVIAAVNGFALGGGAEVALACDFIYASKNAKFGLPEITLGIIPGFGGSQRLPRIIGKNKAKELIFTGSMIDAEEACKIGLVNKVFDQASLMEEAMKCAKRMASMSKVALRAAKEVINEGYDLDLRSACNVEIDAFAICFASPDAKEGTSAFLEKRAAKFEGELF